MRFFMDNDSKITEWRYKKPEIKTEISIKRALEL